MNETDMLSQLLFCLLCYTSSELYISSCNHTLCHKCINTTNCPVCYTPATYKNIDKNMFNKLTSSPGRLFENNINICNIQLSNALSLIVQLKSEVSKYKTLLIRSRNEIVKYKKINKNGKNIKPERSCNTKYFKYQKNKENIKECNNYIDYNDIVNTNFNPIGNENNEIENSIEYILSKDKPDDRNIMYKSHLNKDKDKTNDRNKNMYNSYISHKEKYNERNAKINDKNIMYESYLSKNKEKYLNKLCSRDKRDGSDGCIRRSLPVRRSNRFFKRK
ncbi:hypothetical protein SLOPH_1835 [Spraguea lophii 42_110]|uniref:RING-type domain-containing protein n=1 Tax=Spraguea lophii (strain 42_110) TaxID=1358809 RepID=S7W6E7_SPRLO|nr:hypothetical protein SLOPH_1835 [Spraguea lophii 42_110]